MRMGPDFDEATGNCRCIIPDEGDQIMQLIKMIIKSSPMGRHCTIKSGLKNLVFVKNIGYKCLGLL